MKLPKKVKKISKQPISKIQRKLWEHCKRIIRARYPNVCYTCGRGGLEGSNMHTAHFIPKGACSASLKYNLDNLRICCYNCNINLGGNGAEYYRRMVREVGQDKVDELFQLKNQTLKAYDYYLNLLSEYERTNE